MIDWRDWSEETLESARRDKKPVLLYLAAPWSSRCRQMDELTYADKRVAESLKGFICVKVDAERHPDVYARYQQGGWPTTAFLTPEGEPFFGATYLEPPAMLEAIKKARSVYTTDNGTLGRTLSGFKEREAERGAHGAMFESLDAALPAQLIADLKTDADTKHGGFGEGPKFPLPESVGVLLYAARELKDQEAQNLAVQALKAMAQGLRDPVDGGFFRRTLEPDWSRPRHEKLLADNARLASLYLDAHALTGDASYKDVALDTLGYLNQVLFDREAGAYRGSQAEDEGYYKLGKAERFKSGGPGVDPALYCDSNAMMVPALLKAAAHVPERRDEFEALAVRVLELLETRLFDHHEGMFHYLEPGGQPQVNSLLSDHAWTMIAFTEAFQYFGDREYREFADALLKLTLMNLWHRDRGGFWDRDSDEPALGRVKDPFLNVPLNAVALEALWRLGQMKGIPNYAKWLDMGLRAVLPRAVGPHEGALLGRLVDIHLKGRLELDFIGHREEPKGKQILVDLHRHFLPRKIVSFIDPNDMDFILAHRLTAPRYPRLFVVLNGRPAGSGETLAELAPTLAAV